MALALPPVAPFRDSFLRLGETDDGTAVLMPPATLATHVAVVGAAGSGKTWMAKVIAEEAVLQGVSVLAIDPQGDLVQFLRRADPSTFPADLRQRHGAYWNRVVPRVLTPGSSHGSRVHLDPLRLVRDKDLARLPEARRAEEREALLATVAGNVISLARAGGEVDSQQTFVLQLLRRLAARPWPEVLMLEELARAVHDPEAAGLNNADDFIRKAERERLARKLRGLTHGPMAPLFTGGSPLDLDELRRPGEPGRVTLNVFYLNALPGDEQKQAFVAVLAAEVYRWMITRGGQGLSLLFYLDEAKDYLPAGTRQVPAKNPLLRLLAQGRKYGVAFQLCTQSPRSVDYQAFTNCSTKLRSYHLLQPCVHAQFLL
jgi:DNA helicase HerA-like ATPase